jgi:hypothetical protein
MLTPLNTTGRAISVVLKDMFDGFCRPVFNGETMNSVPPAPPLPATETLLKAAVPPNDAIPDEKSSGKQDVKK